ncbi:MAG: Tryptophan-tRNA ligase [Candidatus Magasanikbacteria bacterium GW2011_GWC2_34_16]|uniref:Tryptophan--tRNA ligase n=2 Tax=Candidatus Magasanikiibacteriota TaxID=1752731 RepID=A0A0G0KGN7_9BACT|nr:MAG: Tryptophan-tRNA ligase [Candidatus Magasanikbacteria bacterium GW2011_GWC2_34_16]KKQ39751.1 MAG: Tryptophan-tRNA ligase [Candidatus Magasanikbacteria bacterium GW2011_GWA2_37_8]
MSRIFSGIQPTNNLHLGNYLGAVKNWVNLQKDNECFFCVVDLHAITVYQDPKVLRQNILAAAKTYLALGVDPKKAKIFVQSDVKEHTELAWILNTVAKISELERMTQFKDKSIQHKSNINVGLFDYPVLMAADILLYDTNLVPVGEDQKQHVELTRVLAKQFNHLYGETFVAPESLVNKFGARIMGLDDPTKKMSKSAASANNYVALLDDPKVAAKKIMRAVTDSGSEIKSGSGKPALTNLLTIYSLLSGETVKDLEKKYIGSGYGAFKKDLSEVVEEFLKDFQKKYNNISDAEVLKVLNTGANHMRGLAEKKMKVVKNKIGLLV